MYKVMFTVSSNSCGLSTCMGLLALNHHPKNLVICIQSLSIPVKIIIGLYKRPLDSYGLKSCKQNDSHYGNDLQKSEELWSAVEAWPDSFFPVWPR